MTHTTEWTKADPFRNDDDGDVGGDDQAGPAHSLRWTRKVGDQYETLTYYRYAARDDDARVFYLQTQTEWIRHTDPDDPGTTEVWSEYDYVDHALRFLDLPDALSYAGRMADLDQMYLNPRTLVWPMLTMAVGTARSEATYSEPGCPDPDCTDPDCDGERHEHRYDTETGSYE